MIKLNKWIMCQLGDLYKAMETWWKEGDSKGTNKKHY